MASTLAEAEESVGHLLLLQRVCRFHHAQKMFDHVQGGRGGVASHSEQLAPGANLIIWVRAIENVGRYNENVRPVWDVVRENLLEVIPRREPQFQVVAVP